MHLRSQKTLKYEATPDSPNKINQWKIKKNSAKSLVPPIPVNDRKIQHEKIHEGKREHYQSSLIFVPTFFTPMLIVQQQYRCLPFSFVFFSLSLSFVLSNIQKKNTRGKNDNSKHTSLCHVLDGKPNHYRRKW